MKYAHLPGGEFIEQGLQDLAAGRESIPALLLSIGRARLIVHNISIRDTFLCTDLSPEQRLYNLLSREDDVEAYTRYNALLDRLNSLEDALDSLSE